MLIQAVSGLDWTGQCGKLSVGASKFRKEVWSECGDAVSPRELSEGVASPPSMHWLARRPAQAEWLPPDLRLWVRFFYLSAALLAWWRCLKQLAGTWDLMLTSTSFSTVQVLGGSKNTFGAVEMDVFAWKRRKNDVVDVLTDLFSFSFGLLRIYCVFTPKLTPIFKPLKSCHFFCFLKNYILCFND